MGFVAARTHPRRATALRAVAEAWMGFEPTCDGFANHCLTTWLPRRNREGFTAPPGASGQDGSAGYKVLVPLARPFAGPRLGFGYDSRMTRAIWRSAGVRGERLRQTRATVRAGAGWVKDLTQSFARRASVGTDSDGKRVT